MKLAYLTPLAVLAWTPTAARAQCPSLVVVEEAVLAPPSPESDFGKSVDVDGGWAIVGGRKHANSGGAEVVFYDRAQGWASQPTGLGGAHTVAMDGKRATAGRSWVFASAYTFELSGSTWNRAPDVVYNGCPHDDFGEGIDIEGDTIVGGAPEDLATWGSILVYDWKPGTSTWDLRYSMFSVPDETGIRIAMGGSGKWVVAAGLNSATIFETEPTTWSSQFVKPGTIQPGDFFGRALAVRGDTVAIGALGVDGPAGSGTGQVFLFEWDGVKWLRDQELVASDASAWDVFGSSLAMDGNFLLVGAPGVDGPNGFSHGAVYVFEEIAGTWTELGRFMRTSPGAEISFGTSVGFDDGVAVVGSYGVATAFRVAAVLPPASYCTAGTTASGCTANVSATGTPSTSRASGFTIDVVDLEGKKDGVLYFGTNGAQANPWGNGTSYQCVVPPVVRTGVQQGVGTLGACNNAYSLDFNTWMAANPTRAPGAGEDVRLQSWFRDPQNTSNQSTSISDAIVFTVCP